MPNGPNCMSFLYRHLVIPDLAPPTCKSNKFLFYGGTVTYSCRRTDTPRSASGRQKFASSSILARSVTNCRLLRANSRNELARGARPWMSARAAKLFEAENFHRQDARRRTRRQKCRGDADEERRCRNPNSVERIRVERHVRNRINFGIQRNQSPLICDPRKRITD